MNMLALPSILFVLLLAVDDKPALKPADVDYEAKLNDIIGKGITPEKNANVLLWQAFGPTHTVGIGMPTEYFKRLGIPEPPKQGEYFVGINRFLTDHLKLDQKDHRAIYDQQGWAIERPWAAKDYPHIAAWLKLNEKPLAVIVEATKRPDYYNPLVSRKTEKDPGMLSGVTLPSVQMCREAMAALCIRAMLHLEEGRTDDAWRDLLAMHRLGRLVGRGASLIETLVGISIDDIASDKEIVYLERANLTAKQALDRLKELQSLPSLPAMANTMDVGERYVYLEALQIVRRYGVGLLERLADGKANKPTPEELKILAMMDWEPAIASANKWFDRISDARRIKDRAAREKEFDKLEEDFDTLKKDAVNQAGILADVAAGNDPGKHASKAIGDILLGLLLPGFRKVQIARDRSEQIERNQHVAFALAAYRADNGRYPAKLDDLAPKYLPAIPTDIFSGKPLIYKPTEKGYLLYSVGPNGKDDEGRRSEPNGDDPRVRMPLPPLKKDR